MTLSQSGTPRLRFKKLPAKDDMAGWARIAARLNKDAEQAERFRGEIEKAKKVTRALLDLEVTI